MRLRNRFYQLPVRFEAKRLRDEVACFDESDWRAHPTGFAGNSAIALIAVDGRANDHFALAGPMCPTRYLERAPYLRQVLAALGTPLSRARLMRIDGEGRVPPHFDGSYHWFRRTRIHVPVRTHPSVHFHCDGESRHMGEGEAWTFDASRLHGVENPDSAPRIHLVADTRGCPAFFELLEAIDDARPHRLPERLVPYDAHAEVLPEIEPWAFEVLTPEEVEDLVDAIRMDEEPDEEARSRLREVIDRFQAEWLGAFHRFGHDKAGELHYGAAISHLREGVTRPLRRCLGLHARYAVSVLGSVLVSTNLDTRRGPARVAGEPAEDADAEPFPSELRYGPPAGKRSGGARALPGTFGSVEAAFAVPSTPEEASARLEDGMDVARVREAAEQLVRLRRLARWPDLPRVDRPLMLVAPPRSGLGALAEALRLRDPSLWWLGGHRYDPGRRAPEVSARLREGRSDRLRSGDATEASVRSFTASVLGGLRDAWGRSLLDRLPQRLRFVDVTPASGLRMPFLARVWPDARFLVLRREPADVLRSLLDAWRSRSFVTRRGSPNRVLPEWSFAAPPGWHALEPRSLAEVVVAQWSGVWSAILDDLDDLDPERWAALDFGRLAHAPREGLDALADWLGPDWLTPDGRSVSPRSLPLSPHALGASPDPGRPLPFAEELGPFLAEIDEVRRRVDGRLARGWLAGGDPD